jgi:hypothetical protein
MLLPEPAKNADGDQGSFGEGRVGTYTFAVDPQESASGLPFRKDTALREPLRRFSMMNVDCNVVICCGIWQSNPCFKVLSQLVPCE